MKIATTLSYSATSCLFSLSVTLNDTEMKLYESDSTGRVLWSCRQGAAQSRDFQSQKCARSSNGAEWRAGLGGGRCWWRGPAFCPLFMSVAASVGHRFPRLCSSIHPSVCTCPSFIILHVGNIQVLQRDACTCKRVLLAQGDIAASTYATHWTLNSLLIGFHGCVSCVNRSFLIRVSSTGENQLERQINYNCCLTSFRSPMWQKTCCELPRLHICQVDNQPKRTLVNNFLRWHHSVGTEQTRLPKMEVGRKDVRFVCWFID